MTWAWSEFFAGAAFCALLGLWAANAIAWMVGH